MKGHLRERSPGHWAIVIDVRDPQTGKRKRRWHSFAGSKRQAQVEAARLISERQNGTAVEPNRITLAQFLDQWLEYIEPQVAPRTHERYGEIVRTYLVPALGTIILIKLQAIAISAAYAGMLSGGRRKGAVAGFRPGQCIIAIEYFRRPYSRPCGGECYLAIHAMMLTRPASSGAP
jgi:Phage integrase, N-terminal SAM-like domain